MRNQLKITQYLIQNSLSISCILIICCCFSACDRAVYIKNKYDIESFTACLNRDSTVTLNFKIRYYSDSSYKNRFSAAIEKGLNGTNSKILHFGCEKINTNTKSEDCNLMTFEDFIYGFNSGDRDFIGQRLEKPINICFPYKNKEFNFILMILKDSTKNKIDTLITPIVHSMREQ